ncbi:tripartite tricarboxylate transporter substrate binding protein [Roseobacter sp. YSTF-M11]|uniref:Tripartite tricarboxylate transporter substrate binding protein n=1 Tax=Roseobacter insulae TaxID=2859783 RepID=A0A9X1FYM1_9RHOB|nr:tripartite tricarboxylate transporter substrate binding protein [Roseobacter insulae]MBW4709757.1 tripartite tricarboxylate transporter substrate binding protein [Roseobacter insulae]
MKKMFAIAAAAAVIGGSLAAEEYPSKTIEVITHAGNGGGTDVTTRMMMIRARRELGTDMVVVNKRGGGGASAMDYYLTQEADGHSILTFTIGHSATVALGKTDMKLDDVRPIARGTDDPQILMTRCGVYESAQAFVEAQKAEPLTYGTTHLGGIDDVSAFMFARRGELATPKIVPFEGGGELATQLVAGAVDVAVLNLAEAGSQIEAGDICPIVVLAPERMSGLPDVSTAQELGIDANFSTVRGFVVHAGTPDDVAAKIEEALLNAMGHTVYQGFLTSVGLDASSVAGSDVWGNQLTSMQSDMDAALRELGFIE